jgi:CRP/FNR family transcriptional regulator
MSALWEDLNRRIDLLKKAPIFGDLTDAALAILIGDLQRRRYRKNDIIYRQGAPSDKLYIVIAGKVRLFRTGPADQGVSIMIALPYDLFGAFGCIDRQPRSSTARALVGTVLLELDSAAFDRHLRTMPNFAISVIRHLVTKARWLATHAEIKAQYSATGRLMHVLLAYKERFGQEEEPQKRYIINLPLNQADLAVLSGVRRQWINQILRKWREQGLIAYQPGQITLLDLPKLLAATAMDQASLLNDEGYSLTTQIE